MSYEVLHNGVPYIERVGHGDHTAVVIPLLDRSDLAPVLHVRFRRRPRVGDHFAYRGVEWRLESTHDESWSFTARPLADS
jgi:hypothetical protein